MSLHSLVLVIGVLAAFAMTCVRVHCICSLVSSLCVCFLDLAMWCHGFSRASFWFPCASSTCGRFCAILRRIESPDLEHKEMLDRRLRWIANAREVARCHTWKDHAAELKS